MHATTSIEEAVTRRRKEDPTVFGYELPPDVPAVHRDVFRWVQSLDLSHSLKNVRRDFANGFIAAEIFSRYFPADVQMHGFASATSSHYKRDNWQQLQRLCQRQGIVLPADLVEGTMRGVHGAAAALLEHLYETFTGKRVPRLVIDPNAMDPNLAAAAAKAAKGGAGGGMGEGARLISNQARTALGIEFGAVQTHAIGDAIALRRRLGTAGTQS